MTMDNRKTITINSPPGSGNMFCQYLMRENFEMVLRWVDHQPNLFDKNGINICILRNPYATIASGVEVNFNSLNKNEKETFLKHLDTAINYSISVHLNNYNLFLDSVQKLEYVTPVGFNLLTQDPDLFLDRVAKKFDLTFKENRIGAKDVRKKMKDIENLKDRLPRNYSPLRKKIDIAVNNCDAIQAVYKRYIDIKSTVDLSLK
jgi:hypothetical protein